MKNHPCHQERNVLIALLSVVAVFVSPPDSWAGDNVPEALPAPLKRAVDFAKDVKPILLRSCVTCHANGKSKGGFNMDHPHALAEGGDSGPAIKLGKSADSLLIKLVVSKDPDEVMPAKGDRLTTDEVAILRAWIDQGAKWEKGFTFRKFRNAPLEPRRVSLPRGDAKANPIDRLLGVYYKKHNITPPKSVSDQVFIRRVFLDVIGLLPTPEEVQAFVKDDRPDKRARLVDSLLADNKNYTEHWLSFWNDALRNSYTRQYHGGGGGRITNWLKASLAANKPYDQFVRELINPVKGSEGFIAGIKWRGTVNASQVTEMQAAQNITQVFLGLNLKCASCHDSFISDWTLEQTYQLASVFSNKPMDVHRCNKPIGKVAAPAFIYPQLGKVDAAAPKAQRVKQLAAAMTSEHNGRLARTMVNRLWAIFLGRGLVEPVDEMDNEPWNTDVLDWLAMDFAEHGYDTKRTIKLILTSNAYQSPSVALDEDEPDFVFTGPVVRRLSAEQFLDAVDQVILAGRSPKLQPRTTGTARASTRNLDRLMRTLGRPKRDVIVTRRESKATTAQLLELNNGNIFTGVLSRGGKAWAGKSADQIVDRVIRLAFGRAPTGKEKQVLEAMIGKPAAAQGIEDVLWIVMLHPEFQLIR